ncbi:MAG: type II toxin-antitoxin system RelE/ParE family toxin [Chitinophagaceae bacterium]|nr:type II toxin-antitoxin system RelE/ParE family toxin [Chitinophagaceae bacterium]
MILSFKHKGLKEFWEKGIATKLPPDQRNKIRLILDTLNDVSEMPKDLELFRNWRVHQLAGVYAGFWSLTVKQNWRIIFRFQNSSVVDIDFLDYH